MVPVTGRIEDTTVCNTPTGSASPESSPKGITGLSRNKPSVRVRQALAGVLLAVPVAAYLWVGSYARVTPRIAGFPFFYWWQILWVVIAVALMGCAYLLLRGDR